MRRPRAAFSRAQVIVAAALLLIAAAGLYLRLRHNDYGLPYVYNYDEATHFTNRAVAMFGSDLDPGYYQNPSGFTYLVYLTLRAVYGVLGFHLDHGTVTAQFLSDDTPIFDLTRTLAAVLATAGAGAGFWVGRRGRGRGRRARRGSGPPLPRPPAHAPPVPA